MKEASSSTAPTSTPSPTRLWLIRHAEVEAAYQGVFGGRIDMNLSPTGQEQAACLAHYLKVHQIDAVYASPMKRVQQTLAPFVASKPAKSFTVPEFREVDFGQWTGLKWAEVHERFGISAFAWLEELEKATIVGAESAQKLRARVEPALRRVIEQHHGRQVALFCHGGVIRSMLSILLHWPLPRLAAFQVEYASVTRVAAWPHAAELQLLNFTPWRDLPR